MYLVYIILISLSFVSNCVGNQNKDEYIGAKVYYTSHPNQNFKWSFDASSINQSEAKVLTSELERAFNKWDQIIVQKPYEGWEIIVDVDFNNKNTGTCSCFASAQIKESKSFTEKNFLPGEYGKFFPIKAKINFVLIYKEKLLKMHTNGDTHFYHVALHEIGHTLGLSSQGAFNITLLDAPVHFYKDGVQDKNKIYYDGKNALREYKSYFSDYAELGYIKGIPIEDDGGSGTTGSHWEELDYRWIDNLYLRYPPLMDEVMSSSTQGLPVYISKISIGALEDFGYTVDYRYADEWKPNVNPAPPKFGTLKINNIHESSGDESYALHFNISKNLSDQFRYDIMYAKTKNANYEYFGPLYNVMNGTDMSYMKQLAEEELPKSGYYKIVDQTGLYESNLVHFVSSKKWYSSTTEYDYNWRNHDNLGFFYVNADSNWIYNYYLKWLYFDENSDENSIWFYSDELKWFWTNLEIYPFCYISELSNWIYFKEDKYYDYNLKKWILIQSDI